MKKLILFAAMAALTACSPTREKPPENEAPMKVTNIVNEDGYNTVNAMLQPEFVDAAFPLDTTDPVAEGLVMTAEEEKWAALWARLEGSNDKEPIVIVGHGNCDYGPSRPDLSIIVSLDPNDFNSTDIDDERRYLICIENPTGDGINDFLAGGENVTFFELARNANGELRKYEAEVPHRMFFEPGGHDAG